MKQIIQDLTKGGTSIVTSPAPKVSKNHVIIHTRTSLISAGTERMLIDFGKASYLQKAKQQPEKVKMVLEKASTDGLFSTIDAVRSKLAQPIPLGYCNVGVVSKVGKGVYGLKPGDRVVSNCPHADVVKAPKNLIVKIPDNVDDESASFVVVGAIALQGIRLAEPSLGECFVVVGAGLIGLLTVQLLIAQGCRVLAIDPDGSKLSLAKQFGAEICNPTSGEDPVNAGISFSRENGVDGVIVTASTKSNAIISQAAQMCRKRGRIILVGVTGLELNRGDFYEKELSFQVSCSYGPGRYDPSYEERGQDYPLGFVRWTEQRNFEAVLDMLASGRLSVEPLISSRFDFNDAPKAYEKLIEDRTGLGIILAYGASDVGRDISQVKLSGPNSYDTVKPVLAVIGAGNYASRVLIPAFKKAGAQFHTLVTSGGLNSVTHGERHGFTYASSDVADTLANSEVNSVVIATRHDTHAQLVAAALKEGKNVFVEKPLSIELGGLESIIAAYTDAVSHHGALQLMVGFNRRFSRHVRKLKALLDPIAEPKSFIMTVNAGATPSDHWTQDIELGGGRIVGEACHFIDLMRYLAGSKIVNVQARRMGENSTIKLTEDKASITLGFEDGSFGTIFSFDSLQECGSDNCYRV